MKVGLGERRADGNRSHNRIAHDSIVRPGAAAGGSMHSLACGRALNTVLCRSVLSSSGTPAVYITHDIHGIGNLYYVLRV